MAPRRLPPCSGSVIARKIRKQSWRATDRCQLSIP
jgi:hypothetical protein